MTSETSPANPLENLSNVPIGITPRQGFHPGALGVLLQISVGVLSNILLLGILTGIQLTVTPRTSLKVPPGITLGVLPQSLLVNSPKITLDVLV